MTNQPDHVLTAAHTAWDFKAQPPVWALLPLAAVEPHGPHLPIGFDVLLMNRLAPQVAERLSQPTYLLPTWPLGSSVAFDGQPGSLWLGYETLWVVIRDVVESLHYHGIHHVAVLNNHGAAATTTTRPHGNFIGKTAVRQLNYEVEGLTAIWVQPFAAARRALLDLFPNAPDDLHAGDIETSLAMHIAPERVGKPPMDSVPSTPRPYLDFVPFARLAPDGVWGYPQRASAEKGARAFDAIVAATADYIETTFSALDALKAGAPMRPT